MSRLGIGVFQAYYQTHQLKNLAPSTISWIPSLEVFMMFVGVGVCNCTREYVKHTLN